MRVRTARVSNWRDPLRKGNKPPLGTKLLLLGYTGVGTIGTWGEGCIAWAPMPKIPPHIKRRIGNPKVYAKFVRDLNKIMSSKEEKEKTCCTKNSW